MTAVSRLQYSVTVSKKVYHQTNVSASGPHRIQLHTTHPLPRPGILLYSQNLLNVRNVDIIQVEAQNGRWRLGKPLLKRGQRAQDKYPPAPPQT
jgi:hypothetical protein